MGLLLLAAFIAVPMIEIGLFIQVGGWIGLWPTLFVVVATAMAGTALLRHQGLGALARLQDSLERGETPIEPVFDGFCLLAAGLLLLTPGFFTDTVGFLLFVPALRTLLRRLVAQRLQVRAHTSQSGAHPGGASFHWHSGPRTGGQRGGQDDIIDGEYTDVSDEQDRSKLTKPDL